MPKLFTQDDLMLALAIEANSDQDVTDLSTTGAGANTGLTAIFADLAYGTSGATTTAHHNDYLYLRRFSGLATNGGASTITLRTAFGLPAAANVLANFKIKITAGTSSGDERLISSNTAANPPVVTVDSAWTTTPDTTSFYEIYPSSSTEDRITRISRALSTGSFAAATGTITVAPAFAGDAGVAQIIGLGADFLFCQENPRLLRTSLKRTLRNLRYPAYLPVTMIPDGDMEDEYTLGTSENFTQWWKINTPTSAVKSTTAGAFTRWRQYLDVVTGATATGKGVQSATVAVDSAENLYVGALVQKSPATSETGDFNVILYDVTNSTALKTVTVTGQQTVIVWFQQGPEATTEEVAIQVVGATSTASNFLIGPVLLWSDQKARYPADTFSLERGRDVNGAFTLRLGDTIESDVYHIGRFEGLDVKVERDDRANVINLVIPRNSYPTFIQVDRRYPELVYDTDTTYAERDMVVQGAMVYVERARAARLMSSNPSLAGFHSSRARQYARTYSQMLRASGMSEVDVMDMSERQAVRFG